MSNVQWFPGHMAKTKKLILEQLKMVDVVVEICDARIPNASRNPYLDDLIGQKKPRLMILNKKDLADINRLSKWIAQYNTHENKKAIAISARDSKKKVTQQIICALEELTADKQRRYQEKGAQQAPIRAMIVGIPNVGKSTLINSLVGKKAAVTGDKPGVTKGKQWIRIAPHSEFLDTPGILWPKFENDEIGYSLAITGAISDEVFVWEEAAYRLLQYLQLNYPHLLAERYNIESENISCEDTYVLMQKIGKKRGAILAGGRISDEKTSMIILKDFRSGRLGPISLE